MFPLFFANKPVERLIGSGIKADEFNDDVLGRCLDALFEADVSALCQVLSEKVVTHLGLQGTAVHPDITRFHVDGAYDCTDGEQTGRLQLVQGYSRDYRPDLNQVVLELICENQAGLPVYMPAMSGNSNDNRSFTEVVKHYLHSLMAGDPPVPASTSGNGRDLYLLSNVMLSAALSVNWRFRSIFTGWWFSSISTATTASTGMFRVT